MKHIALTLSIMLIGASAASAQGIEIRPGGLGGPSIGIGSDREGRGMRRDYREDRIDVRRRDREVETTGNVGCRTTIVKEEDGRGRMTTKRIKTCD